MHNIDNKTTSISKSYTNSKKEELLKVINEAKQKLENVSFHPVGFVRRLLFSERL
jgi:mitogen-activated protein kinase binding protein 1